MGGRTSRVFETTGGVGRSRILVGVGGEGGGEAVGFIGQLTNIVNSYI